MNIEVSDRSDEDGDEGGEKKKATTWDSKRRRRERHKEKKKKLAALKPLSRSAVREVVTSWLKDKNLTCTEKRRGKKVWLEENIDLALLTYEELIETKKELELLKSKSRLYEHASRLLRAETPDRESDLLNLRAGNNRHYDAVAPRNFPRSSESCSKTCSKILIKTRLPLLR